ncbi:MAG: 3-deoxy-manno-octulosonate cytidylyltransferase [Planctomycetaceae bacterium]|nr:3-deoxy-manno-octulosonate cytidylyltransferase [Planctomycetaceae bacterium]
MRAAILIPARFDSTRLPGKLLLAETGLPLICHTAERAARIRDASDGRFGEVVVAADDPRIVDAVETWDRQARLDVRAVMTDPSHQSGSDRIAEVAASLPDDIDAVLNLQGDEPDIDPVSVIDLAGFFEKTMPDIATMVYPLTTREDRENSSLVKAVLGADGRALYFSRADIPFRREVGPFTPPAYGHVGIYLYRRDALERFVTLPPGGLEQTEKLEQLRALVAGMTIRALVLDAKPPKGIDIASDYAEFVKRTVERKTVDGTVFD